MISELFGQIKSWLRAKFESGIRSLTPATEIVRVVKAVFVASKGNALDMGKRYRLTSGHAPLFSLYTFFTNR